MEVILKLDIPGIGYKYDTVTVKPGYGRNFLIPQGQAILANKSNRKMIDENIRQAAHKAEKMKNDAQELANGLEALTIKIGTKAGENGKIFGAVTSNQVAEIFKTNGFDVDRRRISFKGEIKTVGEYEATVDLHREVKAMINFSVVAE
ncbi:LSU ribosomal protein L9p [hydrothermal vent metagenome]|uniref:LSU ribosomal protein L9p n=1 Tax=hydrothermal vent metagenome TaxID=652676 RepID=A0A3B0V172_9ZZZZ